MRMDIQGETRAYRTAWVDIPVELKPGLPPTLEFQVVTAHRTFRTADEAYINFDPDLANWERPLALAGMGLAMIPLPDAVVAHPGDSAKLDDVLQKNQMHHDRVELGSRLSGMPVERPMLKRAGFSIPGCSLNSAGAEHQTAVRFLVGCCRHPGLDVDTRRIQQAMAPVRPDTAFALLVGDQIYADATAGLLDPLSPTERYVERYESAFGHQGLGPLMSSLPPYTTPDDHEWVDAQPNGAPMLKRSWADWTPDRPYRQQEKRIHRWAGRALTAFQNSLRWPITYPNGNESDRHGWTEHRHGCLNLIIIDSRSWRNRQRGGNALSRVMKHNIFCNLLVHLRTTDPDVLQVIVTGSVVIPGLYPNADPANPGVWDTWQFAPDQRKQLLQTLACECPSKFLLVSGDYHVSTAVALKWNNATVGASIVAPPIYAPLPYANAAPEHVDIEESVEFGGAALTQHPCEGSETLRGNGLGEVTVERRPGDGYLITYERNLTVLESGQKTTSRCVITL
jgi:hypothetical protein